MTIFRKRPLTAVALGALFVGAISCGSSTSAPPPANQNTSTPCTISADGSLLTCGGTTTRLTSQYQQICFNQQSFNVAGTTGLISNPNAPMIRNTNIVVLNADGTTSATALNQVVRAKGAEQTTNVNCFNFVLAKEAFVYQVSNTFGTTTGTTRLVPISLAMFSTSTHTKDSPVGVSGAQTINVQDSDTALSTYVGSLLESGSLGGYRTMQSLGINPYSATGDSDFATLNAVYNAWATNRATNATTWGQISSGYLYTYLTVTTPGQLAFLADGPVVRLPGVIPAAVGANAPTGNIPGGAAAAATWNTTTTIPSSYIGDSTDSADLFGLTALHTGNIQAGDCMLTSFAGTNLGATADRLVYTVNGVVHSSTATASGAFPTNCTGYTSGIATGAAGGIVASVVSTATTSAALASNGYYFIRYRDLNGTNGVANDLPAGVFGLYVHSTPVSTSTSAAVTIQAGDGIQVTPYGGGYVLASDTALNTSGNSTTQSLVVNTTAGTATYPTKWFVLGSTAAGDTSPVYGFSKCTDNANVVLSATGQQVNLQVNTAITVSAASSNTTINGSTSQREHIQLTMVKVDYTNDLTAYNNLKAFMFRQMILNGQILDVIFDSITWPTSNTTGQANQRLAAWVMKSGVLCANADNKVTMLTTPDVVYGHGSSFYPNVGVCIGDPHQPVVATAWSGQSALATPVASSTIPVGTYSTATGFTDDRGCVVFYDFYNGTGSTSSSTAYPVKFTAGGTGGGTSYVPVNVPAAGVTPTADTGPVD